MRFITTESKTFSPGDAVGQPNILEQMELQDREGTALKTYAKLADGSLVEQTVSITPAVSRVVRGTIDTVLSDDDSEIRIGSLVGTEAVDFAGDDDGTELVAWIDANLYKIPALGVVNNEDGTFDLTLFPGANALRTESDDTALTFEETTAGVDAVSELVESDPTSVQTAIDAKLDADFTGFGTETVGASDLFVFIQDGVPQQINLTDLAAAIDGILNP